MLSTEYNRLFTFGCSFTDYYWITWADIVAAYLDIESYNFARMGSNTHAIAFSILQADRKYKFTDKDCIIVEWTAIGRDFNITKNNDINICINNSVYTGNRDTFGSTSGSLNHVFSNVQHMYTIEKAFNIISVHMANNKEYFYNVIDAIYGKNKDQIEKIFELYKDLLAKPNFFDTVLESNWQYNIKKYNISDNHPLPKEHSEFCKKVFNVYPNADLQEKIELSNTVIVNKLSGRHARLKKLANMTNYRHLHFPNKWTSLEI